MFLFFAPALCLTQWIRLLILFMRLSFNHLKWELKTNASLFVFHNFSHVLVHNFVFNGILFYPFFISFMNMILWLNLHIRTVVHLHRINHLCTLIFCLFGVLHPTQEFFTHMETSPLPVKGYYNVIWHTCILGTHGYRAVGIL